MKFEPIMLFGFRLPRGSFPPGDCGLRGGADQVILLFWRRRASGAGEIAVPIGAAMIIEYDFGKKERPASKRFARPAGAEAPSGLKAFGRGATPLEHALARVAKLEAGLRAAHAAAAAREEADQGQVLVDLAEYSALLRCQALVAAALTDE